MRTFSVERRRELIAMENTCSGYAKPTTRRYFTPISCRLALSVYTRMTHSGHSVARAQNRKPTNSMNDNVTP